MQKDGWWKWISMMGALCCRILWAKTAFTSVNFQRATPNQAEFEFDCISISKFLLCLCDDVCKKVKYVVCNLYGE